MKPQNAFVRLPLSGMKNKGCDLLLRPLCIEAVEPTGVGGIGGMKRSVVHTTAGKSFVVDIETEMVWVAVKSANRCVRRGWLRRLWDWLT